jgi:hypothetical protein
MLVRRRLLLLVGSMHPEKFETHPVVATLALEQ